MIMMKKSLTHPSKQIDMLDNRTYIDKRGELLIPPPLILILVLAVRNAGTAASDLQIISHNHLLAGKKYNPKSEKVIH